MLQQSKLMVAVGLAVAGTLTAGWSLWQATRLPRRATVPRVLTEQVRVSLDPRTLDTTPTEATVDAVVEQAAASAASMCSAAGVANSPDDLVAAFRVQLAAVLNGNYRDHRTALAARGLNLPNDREAADGWQRLAAGTRFARVGLGAIRVSVVLRDGVRVAPDETVSGFGRTQYRAVPPDAPLPASETAGRLTVVEVQLPVELPARMSGAPTVALCGFRFAWHQERKQWIPWSVVLLKHPDAEIAMPPL